MKLSALLLWGLTAGIALGQGVPAGPRRMPRDNSNLPPILRKVLKAQRNLKFQGRRVVTIRREGIPSSFEDLVWQDGRSTRVEFPPGSTRSGQIIVDTKGQRMHYFPADHEIEVSKSRGSGLPGGNMGAFSKRPEAQFVLGGTDLVAGIPCQVVDGEGPLGGKLRLWIDPQSGMLLRRENYDRKGALVAGFEFKQIEIGVDIPPPTFSLEVPSAKIVTSAQRLERIARQHGFDPMNLPEPSPFNLDGGRFMKAAGKEAFVQMYSGPGGRFSLFRVKGQVDPTELQRKAKGLRSLTWERNGQTFALVGDVDESTLRTVAQQFGKP